MDPGFDERPRQADLFDRFVEDPLDLLVNPERRLLEELMAEVLAGEPDRPVARQSKRGHDRQQDRQEERELSRPEPELHRTCPCPYFRFTHLRVASSRANRSPRERAGRARVVVSKSRVRPSSTYRSALASTMTSSPSVLSARSLLSARRSVP